MLIVIESTEDMQNKERAYAVETGQNLWFIDQKIGSLVQRNIVISLKVWKLGSFLSFDIKDKIFPTPATQWKWKIWIWPTKNRDLGEKIGIMVK